MTILTRKSVRTWAFLLSPLAVGGCATASHVISLPPTTGAVAHYKVEPDSVRVTIPGVFASLGYEFLAEQPDELDGWVVIGEKGATLWSWGEFARFRLMETGPSGTQVWAAARSRYLLDGSGRSGRVGPRLLQALDEVVGPSRILPAPGTTVRGRTVEGRNVMGPVAMTQESVPGLALDDGSVVPVSSLRDAFVLRGSFGRGSEGALVGVLGGIGAGLAACETLDCLVAYEVGGALLGFVLGSAVRSKVWSPADFSGR